MWYEVKKINKNFLIKPLNKLIIELAKKIESGLKSISDNLLIITNDMRSYVNDLQAKKFGLFGASQIIVSDGNVNFSIKGRGEVRFVYLVNTGSTMFGSYFARGLFRSSIGSYKVTIDGVVVDKMPRDNYYFEESFSIDAQGLATNVIATVTLY